MHPLLFVTIALFSLTACQKKSTGPKPLEERVRKEEERRENKKIQEEDKKAKEQAREEDKRKSLINSDGDLLTDQEELAVGRDPLRADIPSLELTLSRKAKLHWESNEGNVSTPVQIDSLQAFSDQLPLKRKLMNWAIKKNQGLNSKRVAFQEQKSALAWNETERYKLAQMMKALSSRGGTRPVSNAELHLNLDIRAVNFQGITAIDNVKLNTTLSESREDDDNFLKFVSPNLWEKRSFKDNGGNHAFAPYRFNIDKIGTDFLQKFFNEQGEALVGVENFEIMKNSMTVTTDYAQLMSQIKENCFQLAILTDEHFELHTFSTKVDLLEALKKTGKLGVYSNDGQLVSWGEKYDRNSEASLLTKLDLNEQEMSEGKWVILGAKSLNETVQKGQLVAFVYLNPKLINKYGWEEVEVFHEQMITLGDKLSLGQVKNNDIFAWEIQGTIKGAEFTWVEREVRDWEQRHVAGRYGDRIEDVNYGTCKAKYLNYSEYERDLIFNEQLNGMRLGLQIGETVFVFGPVAKDQIIEVSQEGKKIQITEMVTSLPQRTDLFTFVQRDSVTENVQVGYHTHNCRPRHDPFNMDAFFKSKETFHFYKVSLKIKKAQF